ncbi:hypothetical protein GCM10022252_32050 [Streptosporangium oxazolinicum]|uniref:Uncharacterized protein n=1 Tax=Streptosporangium oxazolinicum TaxID=909287 RepID=A0ABP8AVT6_9ACTN
MQVFAAVAHTDKIYFLSWPDPDKPLDRRRAVVLAEPRCPAREGRCGSRRLSGPRCPWAPREGVIPWRPAAWDGVPCDGGGYAVGVHPRTPG